jgi:hypothetical protein
MNVFMCCVEDIKSSHQHAIDDLQLRHRHTGAGTYAGADGSRQPSKLELGIAEHQVGFIMLVLLLR